MGSCCSKGATHNADVQINKISSISKRKQGIQNSHEPGFTKNDGTDVTDIDNKPPSSRSKEMNEESPDRGSANTADLEVGNFNNESSSSQRQQRNFKQESIKIADALEYENKSQSSKSQRNNRGNPDRGSTINNAEREVTFVNESPSSKVSQTIKRTLEEHPCRKKVTKSQVFTEKSYINILKEQGISGFQRELENDLDSWKNIQLNIAVVGESGSGKSSLINAILNLNADDEGSAAVGVSETTGTINSYLNSKRPNLVFWDFPGVGTPTYQKEHYFDRLESVSGTNLSNFDFILITSCGRFRENDLWFAKQILQQNKQFYFCRTQIDNDVSSDKKAHPTSHNQEKMLQEILEDIRSQLCQNGIKTKEEHIFLVDSYHTNNYDFDNLMKTLIQNAPTLKKDTLILSMSSYSKTVIEGKVKVLKERVYKVALLACVGNILPIPGPGVIVEMTVMLKEANFYREQFCVDDNSLANISSDLKMEECILRGRIGLKTHTILSSTKEILKFLSIHAASDAFETISKFTLPIIGSIISVSISYPLCMWSLNEFIDMCASEAHKTHAVIADWLKSKHD